MGSQTSVDRTTLQKPIPIVSPSYSSSPPIQIRDIVDENAIPVSFRWIGTESDSVVLRIWSEFDGFSKTVPLQYSKSEGDFEIFLNLPKGEYNYEFEVNGEWQYARDQQTKNEGNKVVNTFEVEASHKFQDQSDSPPGEYTTSIKETLQLLNSYNKPASPLPPHLNRALLNCNVSGTGDTLPVPHHVMINHIYTRPSSNDTTILGLTTRYKTKFVTTVFYQPNSI